MYFSAITFWKNLVQWDQLLFKKINSEWSTPLFDTVMPFLRNSPIWNPLYLFVVLLVLMNFKVKGLWWFVFALVTVALTDMTGTYVFKHVFQRLRPCSDPEFINEVRLVVNQCSGGYSFISNHAANHFGMAVFFFVTFRHLFKRWVWVGLCWAAAIGYAQVYVGVHYPFDVFCGALVGIAFGITTGTFFNKQFGIAIFDNQLAG